MAAIAIGDVNRVSTLVNLPECNLVSSKPGWLPNHQAAFYGQEECLRVLLTGNTNTCLRGRHTLVLVPPSYSN